MRKVTEKNAELFVKRATKYLESIGAVHVEESNSRLAIFHEFTLETVVGEMTISLPKTEDHVYTYTVYARFRDVPKAREVFRCNPFSGKFNFHMGVKPMNQVIDNLGWHFGATVKYKTIEL